MAKWGTTEFDIRYNEYEPPFSSGGLKRIPILADPTAPHTPVEVLQQGGKRRETITFNVIQGSGDLAFYEQLKTDRDEGTVKTFEGPLGVEMDCVVEILEPVKFLHDDLITFWVTLVEAEEI